MTPTAATTAPSATHNAAKAAKGATGSDALNMLTGQDGAQDFGQPFEQLLQQQLGPAPLPVNLTTLLASQHAGEALEGAIKLPANVATDDASTDAAERNGDVMAAAVLAMLGQSQHVAAKVDGAKLETGKGDAQGVNLTALKSHLVTADGADASVAAAAAPANSTADISGLLAGAQAGDEPAAKKTSASEISTDVFAAPITAASGHAAQAAQPHNLQMDVPVNNSAFAQELSQHVAWLGGHDIKEARIRLRPEELGQLDVKVSVAEHGKVDVSFTAQHPQAVQAVQQTLGQLDLMLAGHGLSLGQAQVGQQGSSGHGGQGNGGAPGDFAAGDAEVVDAPVVTKAVGLLDTFA